MTQKTSIQLDTMTLAKLKKTKEHPRQSYNELVLKMIKTYCDVKKKNQYDEFLHKVQQEKMTELWDNADDEAWNDA